MFIEKGFIFVDLSQAQAKQMDAVWNAKRKTYRLPLTLGALRELQGIGIKGLEQVIERQEQNRRYFAGIKKIEKSLLKLDTRLRPYQRVDVSYLSQLPHAGIFNEQRTGKSPTALHTIELDKYTHNIIVCPAGLLLNWKKEIKTWLGLDSLVVKGTKLKRNNLYRDFLDPTSTVNYLIIGYETLRNDWTELLSHLGKTSFGLIVDEAHRLSNPKSQQSKALFQLGIKAKKKLALTGTPAMNKNSDIYGILHFLYPERFSSYWQFCERYFKVWDSPWGAKEIGGYKRKEELQEILDLISVQRKRSEVMKWIPAKQYQTIEVEMSAKQRKAYNEMLEMFTVEEADLDAPSVLAQITRLRQICLSPETLQIEAPSAKESFLLEWLKDNPNEPVVIFSNFSSYLKILHTKIKNSCMITGEVSKESRQTAVSDFQEGNTNVLLANIKAAGVGLTLDRGTTVIFLDRDYVPSLNEQCEDRIIPTTESNDSKSLIIDLVCADSIDETISKILRDKRKITEVINNYQGLKSLVSS